MASEAVLDIDNLIAPITEEQPTGTDLREDGSANSIYYRIKDARNSARTCERKNMYEADSETTEYWRTVMQLAPDILKNHTKDLEITSWYIEALTRLKGFAGMRDGFTLLQQLIENYWDDLFPLPDEDGIETRVAPLTGLNGQGAEGVLIAPIRRVLITQGEDPGPFGFWQYQQALDIQKIVDESERNKKIAAVGFGLADIEKAVTHSDSTFFIDQRDDVTTCVEKYREISTKLDELCGIDDSPSSSNIINALQQCLGSIKHLGQDKFPEEIIEETVTVDEENTESTGESVAQTPVATTPGVINTREQAFKQLEIISEFFRKTEPHSPISYTLEKSVKWGNMSLHELINELIPDDKSRQMYSTLTGVKDSNEA